MTADAATTGGLVVLGRDEVAAVLHNVPGVECDHIDGKQPTCERDADALVARGRPVAEVVAGFAEWVASNRACNGSDHEHGQSLYNECLNAVLPTWAAEFAAALVEQEAER